MVTSSDVRPDQVEVVTPPTLADLARVANSEHELACAAAESAIEHAIRAGEALIAIRERIQPGKWSEWLEKQWSSSQTVAYIYIRVATYREHIPNSARSLSDARRAIRGESLPYLFAGPGRTSRGYPPERKIEAARMIQDGLSLAEAAEAMGVHRETVHSWINPNRAGQHREQEKRRRARLKADRASASRSERDRAVKRAGGGVSELYSLIRKAAQVADSLGRDGATAEIRAGANRAISKIHAAEDDIVRAIGCANKPGMP